MTGELAVDVVTYHGTIAVSNDLLVNYQPLLDLNRLISDHLHEQARLDAIGPVHGPPIPDDIRNHRRHLTRIANIQRNLAYGHPTGHYRRSTP